MTITAEDFAGPPEDKLEYLVAGSKAIGYMGISNDARRTIASFLQRWPIPYQQYPCALRSGTLETQKSW